MKIYKYFLIFICSLTYFALPEIVANSKHNLSTSGPGPIKATTESRICVFCHIPHNSDTVAQLWNHTLSTSNYTLYSSTTLNSTMEQPVDSAKLCLSCHDGAVALGAVKSETVDIVMTGGSLDADDSLGNADTGNLGINLSDDHPVSFVRNTGDTETADPPGGDAVKLDANSRIQCTSCHNPHDNANGYFLVKNNISAGIGSQICITCHNKTGWTSSVHRNATSTTYSGGPSGPYGTGTVAEYGCSGCHDTHGADEAKWLLDDNDTASTKEENVCFNCHNGTIVARNVQASFTNTGSRHNVAGYAGTHTPSEANNVTTIHVECNDCHNAHQSDTVLHTFQGDSTGNSIPANSVLKEVKGINVGYGSKWTQPTYGNVTPATKEYQICFRCHSRNAGLWAATDERGNLDIYFNPNNIAHHAVVAPGNIRSTSMNAVLVNGITIDSTIYCSDCHFDASGNGVQGPHGSSSSWILGSSTNVDGLGHNYVCYNCHLVTAYGPGGNQAGLTKFGDHTDTAHHNNAAITFPSFVPQITCFICHGDFSASDDGGYRVGGIHGANSGQLGGDSFVGNTPEHFNNGFGLTISNSIGKCGSYWDTTGGWGCSKHTGLPPPKNNTSNW